jgi:hypothetical protein
MQSEEVPCCCGVDQPGHCQPFSPFGCSSRSALSCCASKRISRPRKCPDFHPALAIRQSSPERNQDAPRQRLPTLSSRSRLSSRGLLLTNMFNLQSSIFNPKSTIAIYCTVRMAHPEHQSERRPGESTCTIPPRATDSTPSPSCPGIGTLPRARCRTPTVVSAASNSKPSNIV